MTEADRRLIEDYLPLDALNAISAKEKKHPKHPVVFVHYWPTRALRDRHFREHSNRALIHPDILHRSEYVVEEYRKKQVWK